MVGQALQKRTIFSYNKWIIKLTSIKLVSMFYRFCSIRIWSFWFFKWHNFTIKLNRSQISDSPHHHTYYTKTHTTPHLLYHTYYTTPPHLLHHTTPRHQRLTKTAPCILETYVWKIVVWKHNSHLETWIGYWEHKLDIGNIRRRLETLPVYWKQTFNIGNIK